MARRAFVVWVAIVAVESLHGIARELWIAPIVGDLRARELAVLTGSVLVVAVATACSRWLGARGGAELAAVGAAWVAATIAFELALGRLVLGLPWERLTEDYDPRRGGLLAFGMLVLALAPWLGTRLRGPLRKKRDPSTP